MKFGPFCEWPNPEVRDWKSLFEEGLEEIQYSEEMGFEYCLLAEHHFSNYGNSPAPLLQAVKIAERTKHMQIATGILVLPIWDPLRLAEETAVLDNLCDGRFICGVGRGYQPHEMARFGIDLAESRDRTNEILEVLIKAWTQDESFSFKDYFCKHFWITTSGNFSNPALLCCVMEMGVDRILYSVDWPFVDNMLGAEWIPTIPLGAADKAKILSGNAEKLLKL